MQDQKTWIEISKNNLVHNINQFRAARSFTRGEENSPMVQLMGLRAACPFARGEEKRSYMQ